MGRPCIFFDRDGIVNRSPSPRRYVESIEDFHLLPEFVEALRIAHDRGYEAVIITNQRGVTLGHMTQETVDRIHDELRRQLADEGFELLDILVCTDGDDSSFRRKPNPGMLFEAAEKHGLDLDRSWMIGDQVRDVTAGRRAGCRTVLVGEHEETSDADHHLADMKDLPAFLMHSLEPGGDV